MTLWARVPRVAAVGALGLGAMGTGLAPPASAAVGNSTSLAGYQASLSAVTASRRTTSATTFRTRVGVPTVTCPSTGSAGLNEVFNVFGTSGSEFGDVFIFCNSGAASYFGDISGSGDYNNISWNDSRLISVSPGDSLVFTITSGASTASESVDDATSGVVTSFTGLPFSPEEIQVGDQPSSSNNQPQPVPQFTTIRYSDVTYDGSPLSSLAPTGTRLVDSSGQVQIATSNLNSTGNAFSTFFKNSN